MQTTGATLDNIAAPAALLAGWLRVKANGGGAGGDGVDQAGFARNLTSQIDTLSRALMTGRYRPGPLRPVPIKRKDGRVRLLRIPCIVDRVIQTSCQTALVQELDARLSAESFGYRPARSVAQALDRVRALASAGQTWVFDADIAAFFDNVPHDRLRDDLAIWIGDAKILRLIGQWLDGFGGPRGLAQGAPISPLLSNLFLHPLDRALSANAGGLVRYADDFVVMTPTRAQAERAASVAAAALQRRGLALNLLKTRVVPMSAGLDFLGKKFACQ